MYCGGWPDRDSVLRAERLIEMVVRIVWMNCVFMATEAGVCRRVYDLFWQARGNYKGGRKIEWQDAI